MNNSSIKINPPQTDQPHKKEVGQLSVDIYHTPEEIVIVAPIAGAKESDIQIIMNSDVLVIKGTRKNPSPTDEKNYYTKECYWGDFSRAIVLPLDADTTKISAAFEQNVLEVHIPKTKKETTKMIKIQKKSS